MEAGRTSKQGKSPIQPSRLVSLRVLSSWDNEGHFVAKSIEQQVSQGNLAIKDRSLVQAGVLGVLRNLTVLDSWIDHLAGRRLDPRTTNILRLGLFELLLLGTAPHAAVNEYVSLGGRARGLINAIMRRADRERDELIAKLTDLSPHQQHSHPEFLYQRWEKQYGKKDTRALLEWNQEPAPVFIRQNPLKLSALPEGAELVEGAPGFYSVTSLPRKELAEGQVYAQDPSTRHAIDLLTPKSGERILDACASPGGKASMIAATDGVELIAADGSPGRCRQMEENLKRLGAEHVITVCHDWETESTQPHPPEFDGGFDAILVDVPCTNTGVLRRRVEARWRLTKADFLELPERQIAIVESCLKLLRPGGRLIYSTCSIEAEENINVIENLLQRQPHLSLGDRREILPHRDGFDGAFAAVLHSQASNDS